MPTEDVALILKLDNLKAELRKIPGMTDEAMSKMASAASKQWRKVEDAGSKAAKAAEKDWNQSMRATEKIADKVTGGMAGDFLDAAEAVGAIGPAGAAAVGGIAAIGVAVVGTIGALVELERMGSAALDRLDTLGEADAVTDEQRERIERANAALDALWVVADELTVVLAAEFGPAVEAGATALADLGLQAVHAVDAFATTHDAAEELAIFLVDSLVQAILGPISAFAQLLGTLGWVGEQLGLTDNLLSRASAGYDDFTRSIAMTVTGLDGLQDSQTDLNREETEAEKLVDRLAKRRHEASVAAKQQADAQRELDKLYAGELDALRKIGEIGTKANEDTLNAVGKLDAGLDDQLVQIARLRDEAIRANEARGGSEEDLQAIIDEAAAAEDDATARYMRDRQALDKQMTAQIVANAKLVGALMVQGGEDAKESWTAAGQDIADAWSDIGDAASPYLDVLDSIAGSIGDIAEMELERHRGRLDQIRDERKALLDALDDEGEGARERDKAKIDSLNKAAAAEREQMRKAFKASKAAAEAQAIIGAAQAAIAMIPGLALAMGPAAAGAPVAAAALAGLALIPQLAAIRGQEMKFHTGLDPSEYPATLARGEGVANNRAMADPGFRSALTAANAGVPQGGQGGSGALYLNDRDLRALDSRTARVTGRNRRDRSATRAGSRSHYDPA